MQFEEDYAIIGPIRGAITFARGHRIRELAELRAEFGPGQWRKRKGVATGLVKRTGHIIDAELHWYEAAGIGKRRMKLKRRLR
jgi:hypothetical protein